MSRALLLAARGLYTTTPNPRVGCVIVNDGHIVGEGWHVNGGAAHAEVNALEQAGTRALGGTLYVTLEPCAHFGQTPPCVEAIVKSGISRVVFAAKDPNPLVDGRGIEHLIANGISVVGDLFSQKSLPIAILHCISAYPIQNLESINMSTISYLKDRYKCTIGFSDHTMSVEVPVASVALGAVVVEKHFTLDRNMDGPDHSSSLEPDELKRMVQMIRSVEVALGSSKKKVTESEKGNIGVMRKVIVASRDLVKDEILDSSHLMMKRAGEGLEPKEESKLIGMKVKALISKDEPINIKDLKDGI